MVVISSLTRGLVVRFKMLVDNIRSEKELYCCASWTALLSHSNKAVHVQ